METRHAEIRAQQRGITPLVDRLLEEFGDEEHDGHGCIRLFFSHRSIRKMKQALGHQAVPLYKRFFRAYKVESVSTGETVTLAWQTQHLRHL